METNLILQFLKESAIIRNKISLKKLESSQRGEDFNVFNILGLWSEEVRLHSTFLTELLNPNGSHGCGDEFLKAFCSVSGICMDEKIDLGKAHVTSEFYIGAIDEEYETGGRIDILIEMPEKSAIPSIIIENKIYASDQYNQLRRYHNYTCVTRPNTKIFYLTLHGTPPSETSIGEGPEIQYECISYSEHISKWLQRCVTIAFDKPRVRETILQYLQLVKQLTSEDMNETNSIVQQIASNNQALMSAVFVCSYKNDIIKQAISKIIIPQLEEIAVSANHAVSSITVRFEPADFTQRGEDPDWGFEYNISNNETQKNVCLRFVFEHYGLIDLHYGIAEEKTSRNVGQRNVLGNVTEAWPWGWRWFDGYTDWSGETLLQILEEITERGNNSGFSATIRKAIKECSELCK